MPHASANATVALRAALAVARPLVRLLVRNGVAYGAFASALKHVFVQEAQQELLASGRKRSDSAVSLLSGVHRRDLRQLAQTPAHAEVQPNAPLNMASQVVARWLSSGALCDAAGAPLPLLRTEPAGGFDGLVAGLSSDIRPRAVLDELLRLGIVTVEGERITLAAAGFAPRSGRPEALAMLADNTQDHLAAAVDNAGGASNWLEQSIFVDQLSQASVDALHAQAAKVWRSAFKTVMRQAQERFEHDARTLPAEQRQQRARFGVYFYGTQDDDDKNSPKK